MGLINLLSLIELVTALLGYNLYFDARNSSTTSCSMMGPTAKLFCFPLILFRFLNYKKWIPIRGRRSHLGGSDQGLDVEEALGRPDQATSEGGKILWSFGFRATAPFSYFMNLHFLGFWVLFLLSHIPRFLHLFRLNILQLEWYMYLTTSTNWMSFSLCVVLK